MEYVPIWEREVLEEGMKTGIEKGIEKGMKTGIEKGLIKTAQRCWLMVCP
ncbi:MAG: hypothetical protein KAW12_03995 [Candidatus Aminicenantes bacterium]|nr:hypothetical protein [Candidatus Aminicenantes bacterium]